MKKLPNFIRYVAVTIVTVWLLALMITSTFKDDFAFMIVIFIAIVGLIITIPIIGLWLYSFAEAVWRRTKADRILLWFHIADLLMIVIIFICLNLPSHRCDAFVMAQYCKDENGYLMKNTADLYKSLLPDSSRLYVEFGTDNNRIPDALTEQDMKELQHRIEDLCECIGIDINNYSSPDYSTILFRRKGMGMYKFRFYDKPLTRSQQDRLNDESNLIVYNDTIVFEYGSGAFGSIAFPGKEEYLEAVRESDE